MSEKHESETSKYAGPDADEAILAVWNAMTTTDRVAVYGVHVSAWPLHLRERVDALLAEVTAERDDAVREVASNAADFEACYRRHGEVLSQLWDVTAERDALKRRVEELEAAIHLDERMSLLSEKTELECMLAGTPEDEAITRVSLGNRLRNVEAKIAAPPPRAARGEQG